MPLEVCHPAEKSLVERDGRVGVTREVVGMGPVRKRALRAGHSVPRSAVQAGRLVIAAFAQRDVPERPEIPRGINGQILRLCGAPTIEPVLCGTRLPGP